MQNQFNLVRVPDVTKVISKARTDVIVFYSDNWSVPGNSLRAFSSLLEVTPMLETLLHRLPRSSSGSKLSKSTLGGMHR